MVGQSSVVASRVETIIIIIIIIIIIMTVASKKKAGEGGPLIDVIMPLIPCAVTITAAVPPSRRRCETPQKQGQNTIQKFPNFHTATFLAFSCIDGAACQRCGGGEFGEASVANEKKDRAATVKETFQGGTEVKCVQRLHAYVNVQNQATQ